MKVIADFHTHSRFAMACSPAITIKGMEQAAFDKGINLIGTSDFLHSAWLSEIKSNLVEDKDTKLFRLKDSTTGVRFILSGEVSTIFTEKDNSIKKIHHCITLTSLESVAALRDALNSYGALDSDGRPALSMSAAELVEIVFNVDKNAFLFPAHAWTPFFGVLGSLSGYNSIKEAYQDQEKHIHALETGLSSDPAMNWRISGLDKYALLSNSDMHSLPKLGREANVFEVEEKDFSYNTIISAITEKDKKKFKSTVEFYPEEGKYHYDGHRKCEFSIDPAIEKSLMCLVCGRRLVLGVMHRVMDLADRPVGFVPSNSIPFTNMVPLNEIIAYVMRKSVSSPFVENQYRKMLSGLGKEFEILLEADLERIAESSTQEIAEAIKNVRENRIHINPGYDGVFGELDLLNRESRKPPKGTNQRLLTEFRKKDKNSKE